MATSSDPKTSAVCDWLLEQILKDRMRVPDKLPSEHRLSDSLHISRLTVRRTFEALRDIGVLRSQQGAGWYLQNVPKFTFNLKTFKDFVDVPMPFQVRSKVVSFEEHERGVYKLVRVHAVGHHPIALLEAYVLPEVAARLRSVDLNNRDIYNVLEKNLGMLCGRAEVQIEITPMVLTPQVLGVEYLTPVYRLTRLVYDHIGYLILSENEFARMELHRVGASVPRCV